ncbi:MAG TPA: thioredoxin family protein [Edaphobacter sp.]|jgi:thiol:disulfide interchange protein|nr:thioredoxin family protein [Edaphobacter sp.]
MVAHTPHAPSSVSPKRRTPLLTAIALLAFVAAGSVLGCKSNQPAPLAAARQPVTPVPAVKKHLYSAEADPKAEIASALKQASLEHKRVILDFGGDWCGDCQVLDIYFHQSPNLELLDKNFLLVHVDIGRFDKNLDIPEKYNVPLKKGVPALAVLDADGKLLYSQQAAEFGDMRYMYSTSVTDFLNRWKA